MRILLLLHMHHDNIIDLKWLVWVFFVHCLPQQSNIQHTLFLISSVMLWNSDLASFSLSWKFCSMANKMSAMSFISTLCWSIMMARSVSNSSWITSSSSSYSCWRLWILSFCWSTIKVSQRWYHTAHYVSLLLQGDQKSERDRDRDRDRERF